MPEVVDEEQEGADGEMPHSTRRDVAAVNSSLATSICHWMKKHGKTVRPKLSSEQKQQLRECFELMDQDGSGAIDAEELGAAFKLLGIKMKRAELEELLAEVDHDGSGEVEYLEFLEIMTTTLQRIAEEREAEDHPQGDGQVPFALMATAYRRKRLMEGIISGDKEVMMQIMQLSERQAMEAAAAAKAAAEASASQAERGGSHSVLNSITKRSLARLAAMHVDQGMLDQLTMEERRLLSQAAMGASNKAAAQRPHPPHTAGAAAGRRASGGHPATQWPHFSQTASHQQLLETPQVFGLKFSRRSTAVGSCLVGSGDMNSTLPMPGTARRAAKS